MASLPQELDPPDLSGDVNEFAASGTTRLGEASAEGNVHAVRLLLDAGADPNGVDAEGRAPLERAVRCVYESGVECGASRSGSTRIVELLLDAGATAAGIELEDALPEDPEQRAAMADFLRRRRLLQPDEE